MAINYKELPVYAQKERILETLKNNQVIVVQSPTGSGKTTQIPVILHEAGYSESGIIAVTQPRRIATLSVCEYIKIQLKLEGNLCAYTMRFADTSDETTRIKIMTDGILLQELKSDPLLSRYSVIMVDEAHERSLNIDFILGLLKQITEKRKDLKVIISSATINTQKFSTFFDGAKIISIDAKLFPIEIKYINPFKDNKSALEKLQQIIDPRELEEKANSLTILNIVEDNVKNKRGDILIFCSGEYEIKTYETALRNAPIWSSLQVYPLYGRLSKEEQERVFIPTAEGKTKVVIATNIAETSITIDGITTVIVGKPNAGKSSLLNRLIGEEKAIVTDIAGTTRDVLEEQINLNGITLNLIDTAGIRSTEDKVEKIGVEKAKKYAGDADLIIYVVDSSVPLDENDKEIMRLIGKKKSIVLFNKSDLDTVVREEDIYPYFFGGLNNKIDTEEGKTLIGTAMKQKPLTIIKTSMKDETGMEEFENAVKEMFFQGEISFEHEIIITNIRHKELLENTLNSLLEVKISLNNHMPEDFLSIDLMNAYASLGRIIGEEVDDDLMDEIFQKFCLGK